MANGINAPFGLSPYISNVSGADITKVMPYGIGYQKLDATGAITTIPYNIFSGDPVVYSGIYKDGAGADDNAFVGLNAELSTPLNTAGTIVPLSALPFFVRGNNNDENTYFNTPILGVALSAKYNSSNNIYSTNFPFWPASTPVVLQNQIPTMLVNDDPEALFTVQCSTSTTLIDDAIFKIRMIGQNVTLRVGGEVIANPLQNTPLFGLTVAQNPGVGNVQTGQSVYYADLSTVGNGNAAATGVGHYLNFKIMGMVLPTNLMNAGNQNSRSQAVISKLTPGVDMPFVTIFGKINNHVYGAPRKAPITA